MLTWTMFEDVFPIKQGKHVQIAILFTFPDSESYMSLVHPSGMYETIGAWLLQKGPFFRFDLNQFIFQGSLYYQPKEHTVLLLGKWDPQNFSCRFVLYCLILPRPG